MGRCHEYWEIAEEITDILAHWHGHKPLSVGAGIDERIDTLKERCRSALYTLDRHTLNCPVFSKELEAIVLSGEETSRRDHEATALWAFIGAASARYCCNSIQNTLPSPTLDSTPTRPFNRSIPLFTIARPTPVPG